ncbi:phosphomannomutase/phosphoglucomutase [Aeromicrobium sp. PE09-221]|nr:phosphomannomutase/phosphoglucomutase [Aeromicrobium sp. PE09-221]
MIDPVLSPIVKAYDVRGLAPEQLSESVARALGSAFADEVGISDGRGAAVIAHDMRSSSPGLAQAVGDGIRSRGGDVVDIGLASTDELYAASGRLDLAGVMVTASHNPAEYNGLKLCRAGARPIGFDTGLRAIAELASERMDGEPAELLGARTERDFLTEYVALLHRLVPVGDRPLAVVADAGNGMAGHTVPAVFAGLPAIQLSPLYFELDGSFPNHDANPLDPSTLVDLQAAVREQGADLGLAFDGDADRCFVIDECGEPVSPSAITALIAARHLVDHPGATILHNVICSRAVPEIVRESGGTPVRTPVGHSLIKAEMARTGAVFGGEHSGHFYFRDFYLADSGMVAALHVLAALAETDQPLSALMASYERYTASGEINSTVADQEAVLAMLRERYDGYALDELDGLTVTADTWWFNVRASNTEPLLRLNVEADDAPTMERVRDEVLGLIRS